MKNFLLTCFLALLCLVGRYLAASSRVADSPPEVPLHRSGSFVSPHSGDTHRGGAILPDTFTADNFGLISSDQDSEVGTAEEHIHSTSVPVLSNQDFLDQETKAKTSASESLASCIFCLESKNGLVDKHLDPGAGEETASFLPAPPESYRDPVTVSAPPLPQISNSPNQFSLEISGEEASVTGNLSTVADRTLGGSEIRNPKSEIQNLTPGFSLVDDSTSQGQEEGNTPARVGEGTALIYGEIVNPDSLGPIKLELTPYYVDRKSAFLKEEFLLETEPGTFVDGVVDPRARKFSGELPALQRPAYISITVGDRPLMEQYIVFPGDSIKISINLKTANLVFAGPAAKSFELQYQLKRLRLQQGFDRPRKVVVGNPEILLGEGNNRELWESNYRKFSSKLEFGYYGIEGLEKLLKQLSGKEGLKEQSDLIEFNSEFLEPSQIDLILLDAYSLYYFSPVYTLSKFYYDDLNQRLSGDSLLLIKERIRASLKGILDLDFRIDSKLISAEYLNLQVEKLILLALIDGISYLDLVHDRFDGELADRLKASFLTQNLRRYPEPEKMIGQYLKDMESEPWRERIKTLGESTIPGSSLITLEMEDTAGEILSSEYLLNKPTLIYFYFSTCVHSAHYFQDMLWPMYQQLAKEKGVRLIAVSVDKDRSLWLNNLAEYSNPQIDNYRLTEESKNEFVGFYEISGYPRTFLITPERKILAFNLDRSDYSKFTEDFLRHLPKLSDHTSNPNSPSP